MKLKDVSVDMHSLIQVTPAKEAILMTKPDRSPEKRKASIQTVIDIVDLTSLSDDEKDRRVRIKREDQGSPLANRGSKAGLVQIGYSPAPLLKFPPKKAHDMDIRMSWILKNEEIGTLEKRFNTVFSCKFSSSTFHRNRRCWELLRKLGVLPGPLNSEETWSHCRQLVKDDTDEGTVRRAPTVDAGNPNGSNPGASSSREFAHKVLFIESSDSETEVSSTARTRKIASPEL